MKTQLWDDYGSAGAKGDVCPTRKKQDLDLAGGFIGVDRIVLSLFIR